MEKMEKMEKIFRYLTDYPKQILTACLLFVFFFSFFSLRLEIDASTQTLLLDNDKELAVWRENAKKYGSSNFLVVAYTPKDGDILSETSLNKLRMLDTDLNTADGVESTLSILNVPLVMESGLGFAELAQNVPSIDAGTSIEVARREFAVNPLYKKNIVSEDLKTTAIVVNLKTDTKLTELLEAANAQNATAAEKDELKRYRDEARVKDAQSIAQIRAILEKHRGEDGLFLGGMNMISNDMIEFVKSDLSIYGLAVLAILILCLWFFFYSVRFLLMSVAVCLLSVAGASGILGFFGYEITVISSNYIALQLIVTISLVIHLIVGYREFYFKEPNLLQKGLVFCSLKSRAFPCFFAVFTTVVGFMSLCVSDIRPIIALGAMMSLGVSLSLVIAFVFFGTIMTLLPKEKQKKGLLDKFKFNEFCGEVALNKKWLVVAISVVALVFGFFGITKIKVENSFVSYFKESSEIFQGMKLIDEKLGGTIPFDVVVKFKNEKTAESEFGTAPTTEVPAEETDEFEVEESEDEKNAYWFSQDKLDAAIKVTKFLEEREFVGYVSTLGTLLEIGRKLNDGKDLDPLALAILYKQVPQNYKEILLSPYVSFTDNEMHFNARIKDSDNRLRRDAFIRSLRADLTNLLSENESVESASVSGVMILYNNMLQSLFSSQFDTLGLVVLVLFGIFVVIFRSVKYAIFGLVANLIPLVFLFGLMGVLGIPLDIMSITIAAISLGIGVDNVIHYIYRFQFEIADGKDVITALRTSSASIGVAMYYTSLTILLGFGVMMFSNFYPTVYFGFLTSLVMTLMLFGALVLLPMMLAVYSKKGVK